MRSERTCSCRYGDLRGLLEKPRDPGEKADRQVGANPPCLVHSVRQRRTVIHSENSPRKTIDRGRIL